MMLQQDQAEDFVIATGKQISVREFIILSAKALGIELQFTGHGIDEIATVVGVSNNETPGVRIGDVIMRIDPRYFRPTEVETLLGDPSYAKARLGWEPEISVEQMCAEMVLHDLTFAKQHALLRSHGFHNSISIEN